MTVQLKTISIPSKMPKPTVGAVLRKVTQAININNMTKADGFITEGILEATQVEGGFGWAISDYIQFGYSYVGRPIFTWGLDGTAELSSTDAGWSAGDNSYTQELPATLSALTPETYQPAIFVPRIIHWYKNGTVFYGCYLLVCQVNPNCTELDKAIRIHYRFEGRGVQQ